MFNWARRRSPSRVPLSDGSSPRGPAFDAVVDLPVQDTALVERVEAAVRAVPGAGRVRVRQGMGVGGFRVFAAGTAQERTGEGWGAVRAQVEAAVGAVLARRPAQVPPGFAEAPASLDALSALSALAQSVRAGHAIAAEPQQSRPSGQRAIRKEDVAALATLLGFVLPDDGRATAVGAVRRFGSFAAVLAAPPRELLATPGLGPHSAAAIKLVHEAATRLARAGLSGHPVLDDRAALAAYLAAAVGRERIEQFRILFLDDGGLLRADEVQARGTVNHTPVYPREVMRRALELDAVAVVLVHNHPSGDPTPSPEDIAMTHEMGRAAAAVGVALRDHIIVGNGRTLSFRDAGLI